jgi:hypothetical protein
MIKKYPIEWWRGMKAVICDFCGLAQPVDDEKSMAYSVDIFAAEGFEIKSDAEKELNFEAEHLCTECTKLLKAAFEAVRDTIKQRKATDG